ncbi:hypothetical protein HZA98_01095 [Candidatus Woesearchaeota archaeon]|nr:hypothetical protein [Candidatus Woesearchaeota archaeon]
MLTQALGLGLLGGLARACVGLLKALRNDVSIIWSYTLITIIASGIIGAAAGVLFDGYASYALIAGYIGTDILENAYKIIFKKQVVSE